MIIISITNIIVATMLMFMIGCEKETEDSAVAELIEQREEEEALQREAEERLAAEQAARAEEDARLRELYPLPEDEEEYEQEPSQDIQNGAEDLPVTENEPRNEDIKDEANESSDEEDGAR